jgi:hypothetical protein
VFTQIHPFQDGNGRVARALASLVFIKSRFFPLVITRDDRARYIDALERADRGDLSQVVRLFAQVQKRALTKAITMAVDVEPVTSVDEAIAATRDMLVDLGRIIPAQYLAAKVTAQGLASQTVARFVEVTAQLANDIAPVNPGFAFGAGELGGVPVNELRDLAEKLQYDPNADDYHQAVVANLVSGGVPSRIVVSFDSVGSAFRGLAAAMAYFQTSDKPPIPLSDDVFRISYKEPRAEAQQRYTQWLDQCLVKGLGEWRCTLA